MQHALRLAGRAGGIKDEQRVFSAHLHRRAIRLNGGDFLVVPDVAAGSPAGLAAGAAHHQNLVDDDILLGGDIDRLVGVFLERDRLAAAHALIAGDDEGGLAVNDAARQRFGRKAAKDDRMDGADAGAGEHRISRFGYHRHIDGDAVTLLDAVLLQHIRKTADIIIELVIGDLLVDIGVIAFPDDRRALAMRLQVTVDTVIGDVGEAVLEPLDRHPTLEGRILDLGIGLEPVDPPAVLVPELFRILDALLIPFLVTLIVDERAGFRRFEHGVDFGRHELLLEPDMA
ncbi:hypothetical protein D3C86_1506140 [compost metagenome]